ncbi:class A beta-lactamase [Janibacter indicus]|uniref:Class A beta-lactamase n=1 Tax=Janibacter indicus TaxID=857417 RepID=A0A7L9J086_9MICO|nr:class A beta-lactamase [Janibacter indicus]QOK22642.1 class A beta-lactamase [Janibacter indicus]
MIIERTGPIRTPSNRGVGRRRLLAAGLGVGGSILGAPTIAGAVPSWSSSRSATSDPVAALEDKLDSRIGLYARNLGTDATLAHRADDREAMCSTFKTLAAATALRRGIDLDRVIRYARSDLVDYSPITGERRRMTVGELCDAAIRYSDNAAANLLLERIGGPRGLTRDLRRLGDRVTRLDRWETELNTAIPGDPRDTSTPRALATTYRRLTLGDGLTGSDRWALRGWLEANTTSVKTFRAGLPEGWWSADKTGSGSYGVTNCAGLVSAPDGTQIIFAALTRRSTTDPDATGHPGLMRSISELIVAEVA